MMPGIFYAFIDPLIDTALEPDLADVLWSLTDLFHRKSGRVQRQLDDNEQRQRDAQAQQDGWEIRSSSSNACLSRARHPRAPQRLKRSSFGRVDRSNHVQIFGECRMRHRLPARLTRTELGRRGLRPSQNQLYYVVLNLSLTGRNGRCKA
jgi:hypothetical protein